MADAVKHSLRPLDILRILQTNLLPRISRSAVLYPHNQNSVPLAVALALRTDCELVELPSRATHVAVDVVRNSDQLHGLSERYPGRALLILADMVSNPALWHSIVPSFPWNPAPEPEECVRGLLESIGEDPDRGGLRETPARVIKGWREWSSGYKVDPAALFKTFDDGADGFDQMVIVHNVPVVSKCEHHLADIQGIAHVGYIPDGKIVGLSKLARVVDAFARRLQVQERMTVQIADTILQHLKPKGVGVLIRAGHACMSSRGVKIHGSVTTTSAMRGVFLDKPEAKLEFLQLCRDAEARHD